jgi:hypothetical protein
VVDTKLYLFAPTVLKYSLSLFPYFCLLMNTTTTLSRSHGGEVSQVSPPSPHVWDVGSLYFFSFFFVFCFLVYGSHEFDAYFLELVFNSTRRLFLVFSFFLLLLSFIYLLGFFRPRLGHMITKIFTKYNFLRALET